MFYCNSFIHMVRLVLSSDEVEYLKSSSKVNARKNIVMGYHWLLINGYGNW